MQYIKKGNITFNNFKIMAGVIEVSAKLSIPVVQGKLTATGTTIDLRGSTAAKGTSAIEAVYIYIIYDSAGKVVRKSYYTFAGKQLELSNAKVNNKVIPRIDNEKTPGLVTVENKEINNKDNNGTVKVGVANTELKVVTAKYRILGKIKK